MKLHSIPTLADNYIWALVHDTQALVVDPGDADVVLNWLHTHQLQLAAILVTHHHADHTAGVAELHRQTQAQVFAPAKEWLNHGLDCTRVSSHTHATIQALNLNWQVFDVPGHTLGHVAYWCAAVPFSSPALQLAPVLFCGDTLFSGGCGRLFEGTAADMYASLMQLSALPNETLVCCAHEYTVSNLRFAQAVEPDNRRLQTYRLACEYKRSLGESTLPSTIEIEKQINPFLRVAETSVKEAAAPHQPLASHRPQDILGALRQWKNDFQ